MANPRAQNSLVIGFGTGASSSILSRHTKTTTVEIEPKVLKTAGFFEMINAGVFNANHEIVFDDARHYLLRTQNKYDVIANHSLELYQSFSSLLFTKEFLEISKSRLSPDGLYFQWFPLYDLKPEEFQGFYKTFNSVFPHQMVFVNLRKGENVDYEIKGANNLRTQYLAKQNSNELIIIGSANPIALGLAALRSSFSLLKPEDRSYLQLTSLNSPEAIFNLLLFEGEELKGYYEAAAIITDDKPSLEFSTPFRLVEKSPRLVNRAMDDLLNYIELSRPSWNDQQRLIEIPPHPASTPHTRAESSWRTRTGAGVQCRDLQSPSLPVLDNCTLRLVSPVNNASPSLRRARNSLTQQYAY